MQLEYNLLHQQAYLPIGHSSFQMVKLLQRELVARLAL
jgi:hypothetical protein